MQYGDLARNLRALPIPFEEGAWRDADDLTQDYGTYAVEGDARLGGDDRTAERRWRVIVTLEIYGDQGFAQAALVEDALDATDVPWNVLIAGAYDPETGYTYWRWAAYTLPDEGGS